MIPESEWRWAEIDSLAANESVEAEANHIAMCRKYAEAT